MTRRPFYCTFGSGSPLSNYYVVIEAPDAETARLQMWCWFTTHWCGCYDEAGWRVERPGRGADWTQANEYGLSRLRVPPSASLRLQTNHDEIPHEIMARVYGDHDRGDGPPE